MAVGREKEGKLATTSLEFEYLHRKSRCEMLIGRDGISNVITLLTCFSMFVYIRTRFRITLIGGNVTAQSTESRGNWRWNSNSRDVVASFASSPSFSCPAARAHRRACSQATLPGVGVAAAFFPSVIIVNNSRDLCQPF